MASESKKAGGIGFFGGLALLLIGLKLGGVIHWHWAYVLLLPLLGPLALFLAILAVIAVVLLAAFLADLLIHYFAPRAATDADDADKDDDA